ncbi:DEAD/DEAH box helicase family protein [Pseudomonas asiatica]|uniref:DEAD/DEAH box helicase family protein n=1 Tax=Pseudomonas asiatica TaxID=2219225 RepID=UPI0025A4AE36|nr:DEAD/DEAH box helicase [Pseudomonas asiatica]WJN48288.1 helix-turn-helix domain-containing protein [Pseudomonas asiatica]
MKEKVIFAATGAPGSGKTESVLQALPALLAAGKHIVIAFPTVNLINEIAQRIEQLHLAYKRIDSVSNIDSRQVVNELNDALECKEYSIVLCTHTSIKNVEPRNLAGWDLVIDELPQVVNYFSYYFDEAEVNNLFTHLEQVKKQLVIRGDHQGDLQRIVGVNGDITSTWSDGVRNIFRLILSDEVVFIEGLDNNRKRLVWCVEIVLSWWRIFATASKVDVLAANIAGDFKLHSELNGFQFKQSEFAPSASTCKCPVTIYPLIRKGSKFSKRVALGDVGQELRPIDLMLDTALKNCANTPLVSANNWSNLENRRDIRFMSKESRGLNQYSDATDAILLFGGNPSPAEIMCLKDLAGKHELSYDVFFESFITTRLLEPSLQCVARTALRKPDNIERINLFVQDERVLKYLTESYLQHAIVNWSLSDCLPSKADGRYTDPDQKQRVLDLVSQGMSDSRINRETGVSRTTIRKWKAQQQAA